MTQQTALSRVDRKKKIIEHFFVQSTENNYPFPVYFFEDAPSLSEDFVYFHTELDALRFLRCIIKVEKRLVDMESKCLGSFSEQVEGKISKMKNMLPPWMYEEFEKEKCKQEELRLYAYAPEIVYERKEPQNKSEYCEDYGLIEEYVCCTSDDDLFETYVCSD